MEYMKWELEEIMSFVWSRMVNRSPCTRWSNVVARKAVGVAVRSCFEHEDVILWGSPVEWAL